MTTNSSFKHDSAGFLIGDLIDMSRELLVAQDAGMAVWRGIGSDVKAIARALGVQARMGGRMVQSDPRATPDSGRLASAKAFNEGNGASGRFVRQVATPVGRAGNGASRMVGSGTGAQRTATSAAERAQGRASTATVTPTGRSRVRTAGLDNAPTLDVMDARDGRGRFTAGSRANQDNKEGGASGKGAHDATGLLTNAIGKLGDSIEGAQQLDPTLAAMKEVKEVLSPLGRGMFSMFGRSAESKKERWYKRLLKAITGRKDSSAPGAGMGTDTSDLVSSGLVGALAPMVMRFIGPVLAAIGAALLAGLSLLGGVALGEFIYKWLTDSGLMAKIFDAVDAAKQAVAGIFDWGKSKIDNAKAAVNKLGEDFNNGQNEQMKPAAPTPALAAPPTPNAPVPNNEAPVQFSATPALKRDRMGRTIKNPDQVPEPGAELLPATSLAQRAGRFVGGIRSLIGVNGTRRTYENNDGSTEERSGGTVAWRNNNPGNLKLEYAGSDDPTVKTKRTKANALAEAKKRYEGVVNLDQFGNVIFSTQEAGRAAQAKLLTQTHGRKTVEEMLPDYAKDDVSGKANHKAYANGIYKIADAQGVDLRGKKIGDLNPQELSALLDGMKKVEGFKVGTITPLGAIASSPTMSAGTVKIPPVSIPSSVPERIAPVPDAAIPAQLNNTKPAPVNVSMREPIGQDVGDRSIAHVVSGGLGMMG